MFRERFNCLHINHIQFFIFSAESLLASIRKAKTTHAQFLKTLDVHKAPTHEFMVPNNSSKLDIPLLRTKQRPTAKRFGTQNYY